MQTKISKELEVDGIFYDILYIVNFNLIPGEKPTYYGNYSTPGSDPEIDLIDIDVECDDKVKQLALESFSEDYILDEISDMDINYDYDDDYDEQDPY